MARVDFILPDDVFEAAEKIRLGGKSALTQSQFYRLAVEEYVRQQIERRLDEQYIKGYLEHPETPEEVEWVMQAGLPVLAENPWEEDQV